MKIQREMCYLERHINGDSLKTLLLDIQRGSVHDGPGVRTTVFVKGCPLRCKWCHNPESQNFQKELSFHKERCTNCSACVSVCEHGVHAMDQDGNHMVDYKKCKFCGSCVDTCMQNALKVLGHDKSVEEVYKEVLKDKDFYKISGGGMTLSGGEILYHSDFAIGLLRKCKQDDIHTCIETSGYDKLNVLPKLLPYTDLFYFDWKISNHKDAATYLGVEIETIKSSLNYLLREGATVLLRCPIIPSVNDTKEHFDSIILLLQDYPELTGAELLPYHDFGTDKNRKIGLEYETFEMPSEEAKQEWLSYFESKGIKNIKIS